MITGREFIVEEPGSLAPNLKRGYIYRVYKADPSDYIPYAHHITSVMCRNDLKIYATSFHIQDDGYVFTTLGGRQPCFSLGVRPARAMKYAKGEQMNLFDSLEKEDGQEK